MQGTDIVTLVTGITKDFRQGGRIQQTQINPLTREGMYGVRGITDQCQAILYIRIHVLQF